MKASAFFASILGSSQDPFAPEFKVFANGSIVPQIGSDDAVFSRVGDCHYWTSKSTVAIAADGEPEENAFPADRFAPVTARKGVLLHGINRNEALETNSFDQWDLIGSPTVTANAAAAPDGTMTADRLQLADGEGISFPGGQDSTQFDGAKITVGVAIKAVSGTPTIKVRVKDEGNNYATSESEPAGFTVTNEWRLYEQWCLTPTPGSGNLVAEITASGGAADVYVAFCYMNFVGTVGGWDNHSAGHIPSYKGAATNTRLATDVTTLSYTSPEIVGSISEYTANFWVYIPSTIDSETIFPASIFSAENEAGDVLMYLETQGAKLKYRLASTSDVEVNTHSLYSMTRGRWTMVTYALKSGDSAIYVDGQPIITSAATFSPFTIDYFSPGMFNRTASGDTSVYNFEWPMSGVEIWKERKDNAFIAGLYDARVAGDAPAPAADVEFPTAGAVDVIRCDVVSGNITSEVEALTATKNGTVVYQVQGPRGINVGSGLKGIRRFSSGSYFDIASLPAAYNLGALESFVVMAQVRIPKLAYPGGEQTIFDCSDYANTQGFLVYLASTTIDFWVVGAGGTHVSIYTHGGKIKDDGKFWTIRWVFNRANNSADIYLKAEGETELGPFTCSIGGSNFADIGAATLATNNLRIGTRANSNDGGFTGNIYQIAYAKGTTYDAATKP